MTKGKPTNEPSKAHCIVQLHTGHRSNVSGTAVQSASLDAGRHAYYSGRWTLGSQEVKYKDECTGPRPSALLSSYCATIIWLLNSHAWLGVQERTSICSHALHESKDLHNVGELKGWPGVTDN